MKLWDFAEDTKVCFVKRKNTDEHNMWSVKCFHPQWMQISNKKETFVDLSIPFTVYFVYNCLCDQLVIQLPLLIVAQRTGKFVLFSLLAVFVWASAVLSKGKIH